MFKVPTAKVLGLVSLFALALIGCERKGKDTSAAIIRDPRVEKKFAVSAPWFCAIPIKYSVSDAGEEKVVSTWIAATGETKKATYEALKKNCDSASEIPKKECSPIVANDKQKCVGVTSFVPNPSEIGLWTCAMSFTVNDKEDGIETSDPKKTGAEAILDAFTECLALKDAETDSTSRRDACIASMISRNKKMICTDENAGEAPRAKAAPAKRKLTRVKK